MKYVYVNFFILLIISSITFGLLGGFFLGVATGFDKYSFHPSLISSVDEKNQKILCSQYQTAKCEWMLYSDYNQPSVSKSNDAKSQIDKMVDTLQTGKLIPLKNRSNQNIDFYQTRFIDLNGMSICSSIESTGYPTISFTDICQFELLDVTIYNNINSTVQFGVFDHKLVDDISQDILCDNFLLDCFYDQTDTGLYEDLDSGQIVQASQVLAIPEDLCNFNDPTLCTTINPINRLATVCNIDLGQCTNQGWNFRVTDQKHHIIRSQTSSTQFFIGTFEVFSNSSAFFPFMARASNQNTIEVENSVCELEEIHNMSFSCKAFIELDYINILPDIDPLLESFSLATELLVSVSNNLADFSVGYLTSTNNNGIIESLNGLFSEPSEFLGNFSFFGFAPWFIILIVINILIGIVPLWHLTSSKLSLTMINILKGPFGTILDKLRIIDLPGKWYIEEEIEDPIDSDKIFGLYRNLIFKRWKDTILFPAVFSANIALILIALVQDKAFFSWAFLYAPLAPLLLTFWIPVLWVIQDSAVKSVKVSKKNDEIIELQQVSVTLRNGSNTLFSIGAFIGIATIGINFIRPQLGQKTLADVTLLSSNSSNFLGLNFSFIFSSILWTIGLILLLISLSITGMGLNSAYYLATKHKQNVESFRQALIEKNIGKVIMKVQLPSINSEPEILSKDTESDSFQPNSSIDEI